MNNNINNEPRAGLFSPARSPAQKRALWLPRPESHVSLVLFITPHVRASALVHTQFVYLGFTDEETIV